MPRDLSFAGVRNAPDARGTLSYSAMSSFRRCQREFWWKYVRNLEPVRKESYFRQGSLWHAGLEALYASTPTDPIAAMDAFAAEQAEKDPEMAEQIRKERHVFTGLMRAYLRNRAALTPPDEEFRAVESERAWRLPLRHPDTGRRSRWYDLSGVLDAVVEDATGGLWLLEHKTTSDPDDILGKTATDLQLSIYFNAATELYGADRLRGAIYNVVRKPLLRPRAGESVEAFGLRVEADADARPEWYFRRERVYRNAHALASCREEVWQTAQDVRGREYWLRNYSACDRCSFGVVCHEPNDLAERTLFRDKAPLPRAA